MSQKGSVAMFTTAFILKHATMRDTQREMLLILLTAKGIWSSSNCNDRGMNFFVKFAVFHCLLNFTKYLNFSLK